MSLKFESKKIYPPCHSAPKKIHLLSFRNGFQKFVVTKKILSLVVFGMYSSQALQCDIKPHQYCTKLVNLT